MDVSVIIINYNTLELTKNTIDSVIAKTKNIDYEIILVDNDSQDGSKEFFSKKEYKNKIKFIKNDNNLGFGKANNLGIDVAAGKYIFLLNSDTLLVNNAIKILYDFMEKNDNVGISGGNLYNIENEPTHSYGEIPRFYYEILSPIKSLLFKVTNKGRSDFNYSEAPKQVGYITGADMFIRKEALNRAGYFNPDFFMYFEETELTVRIKKLGYIACSVPRAQIIHLEGQSFEFKENRYKMFIKSKYQFYEKVYGEREKKYNYVLNQIKCLIFFTKENKIKFKINAEIYGSLKGDKK